MAATTSQWWVAPSGERLRGKAGMVYLQGKRLSYVIHTWALKRWCSHIGAGRYTNLCTLIQPSV